METLKRFIEHNQETDISDLNIFKINHSFSREFAIFPETNLANPSFEICLPFRRCFVDFKKSYLLQQDFVSVTSDCVEFTEISPEEIHARVCIRIFDGNPEKFYTLGIPYINNKPVIDRLMSCTDNDSTKSRIIVICNMVTQILEQLCSRKYIYVENDNKIDVKFRDKATRKLHRVKYTPKRIIYISDKKTFNREHPELSGRVISKPQYAFACMGHWRKLTNSDHLGKNRNGEYLVEGYTWVVPHIKCADRGELLKKVRVIE